LLPSSSRTIQDIDWKETRAYSSSYGAISINLEGREPQGKVQTDEYEKLRNEIMRRLKGLVDVEMSSNVVDRIWKREEVYWGPHVSSLPDIVIQFKDESKYESVISISEDILGDELFYLPSNPPVSSAHTRQGIFAAYGPDVKRAGRIGTAQIYDIAPTILHMFGIPIPRDTDGRVLKEIFNEGSELATREIIYQEVDADDEKWRIRERMRELKAFGKT